MYLHGQIPQSQGLSQLKRITEFELAGAWAAGSMCVGVASGMTGPAACSRTHLLIASHNH